MLIKVCRVRTDFTRLTSRHSGFVLAIMSIKLRAAYRSAGSSNALSTAKQAQSRAKMLARMQPIAALIEDPSLSFDFPDPDQLRSPMITFDQVTVGYGEAPPILRRLNFRIEADDRIALLGRNGNGKTTMARLLASQLDAAEGEMNAPGRMKVGYFTQYQVEELAGEDTPLDLMNRAMEGAAPRDEPGGRAWKTHAKTSKASVSQTRWAKSELEGGEDDGAPHGRTGQSRSPDFRKQRQEARADRRDDAGPCESACRGSGHADGDRRGMACRRRRTRSDGARLDTSPPSSGARINAAQ